MRTDGRPLESTLASAIAFALRRAKASASPSHCEAVRTGSSGGGINSDAIYASAQRRCMKPQVLGDERADEVVAVVIARALAIGQTLTRRPARLLQLVGK